MSAHVALSARWVSLFPLKHSDPLPIAEALACILEQTHPECRQEVLVRFADGRERWIPAFWKGHGNVWRPRRIWFEDACGGLLGEVLEKGGAK